MTKIFFKETRIYLVILILFTIFLSTADFSIAQDAQSFYQNGYQYFSQGDYQKAEENYQKAVDLDPNFEDAHYWLGKVYRQTGQHEQAIQQWIEVLRINPRNPYAFRYLNERFQSTYRVQNGNASDYYDEGLAMLEVSNETFLDEKSVGYQTLLSSVPYFKKAIDLQNDFVAAYYWLGEAYQALSKKVSWQYTSMAISSFEEAIAREEEQNPDMFTRPSEYWYAYQELMLLYYSLGLNERRENLLSKLQENKQNPYKKVLEDAGYPDLGYPDQIEIISQDEEVIELWKYNEENKTLRVVNKEIKGEELTLDFSPEKEEGTLSEEMTEEMETADENEL